MKRIFTLSIASLFLMVFNSSKAQNTYFTEYFDNGATAITGTTANAATTPTVATIGSGDWTVYYAFRAGSGCTPNDPAVTSAKGLRVLANTATTPAGLSTNVNGPNAYLITPKLSFGVNVVSWKNTSATTSGSISVYKSTNDGASYTLVQTVSTLGTACSDYSVTINDVNVNRIKFQNESAINPDLDNITITSVNTILPVKFTNVSANKVNSLTKISWNIESEINAANYVVERSIDGTSFSPVETITATNAGKYSYIDLSASGSNYYRIKAIDKDGSFVYSAVVFTVADTKTAAVTVYPNPITNKQVNVQLSNLSKGSYSIEVYNNLGQAILSKAIQFDGGTTSLSLQLPTSVNAGLYRLSVSNGVTKINKTISVQ